MPALLPALGTPGNIVDIPQTLDSLQCRFAISTGCWRRGSGLHDSLAGLQSWPFAFTLLPWYIQRVPATLGVSPSGYAGGSMLTLAFGGALIRGAAIGYAAALDPWACLAGSFRGLV